MTLLAKSNVLSEMHITNVRFDNFKSLVDFELPLAKLTCLIGLNGSGKTTVIQGLDFLSRLFVGDINGWLNERGWVAADINSKLIKKSNVDLRIEMTDGAKQLTWSGSFNRSQLRCTKESLRINGEEVFSLRDGKVDLAKRRSAAAGEIAFEYSGSVLSALKPETLGEEDVIRFVHFMRQVTSLDLLSPQSLRRRTDRSDGRLGLGGERLSAFLYELPLSKQRALVEQLIDCYPRLKQIETRSLRRGWKELSIVERFGERSLTTEATHINDGLLRLMAILAETLTSASFLLFDEIENGINPELVEFLLDSLLKAPQQVLVTTHSPMILNWLDDEVARAGVQYLYRDDAGRTRSVPFFSIPSLNAKLAVMGPGEAFVDTELSRLPEEIAATTEDHPG